jgi:hypothetical protein
MPLISHEIEGHDDERHAFRFFMLNDDQVVVCQISDASLDELAGAKGTDAVTDPVKDTLPCTVTFAPENNEPHLPIVGVPVNASAPLIFHDDP